MLAKSWSRCHQINSAKDCWRLVMRDEAPMSEIFSHELAGVALSLFLGNGEMRKNNKAEIMNEILRLIGLILSKILTDVSTESAYVIDGCAWLDRVYWEKAARFQICIIPSNKYF